MIITPKRSQKVGASAILHELVAHYTLLALILFFQCFTRCYASQMQSRPSLHERYFRDPYIKMGIQLPITRKVSGYVNTMYSDSHDKPSFRPFYLIAVGNKFKYFNIELEGFYLNLPSKTYIPNSTTSSITRFSAMGAFINASVDIVRQRHSSIFVGAGIGMSENTSHDLVWTSPAFNIVNAKGQRQIRPAFQIFAGVSHNINQNFAVEGLIKYLDLGKFSTQNEPLGITYQGSFKSLSFNINLKYSFSRYKSGVRQARHWANPPFARAASSYGAYRSATYMQPGAPCRIKHKILRYKAHRGIKLNSASSMTKLVSIISPNHAVAHDQKMTKVNFHELYEKNNTSDLQISNAQTSPKMTLFPVR